MSDPAALLALPGLIRAARECAQEHTPRDGAAGVLLYGLSVLLTGAELTAEGLAEVIRLSGVQPPPQGQQQFHAPLGDQVEPRVPRWSGHDPRLPPGAPHP